MGSAQTLQPPSNLAVRTAANGGTSADAIRLLGLRLDPGAHTRKDIDPVEPLIREWSSAAQHGSPLDLTRDDAANFRIQKFHQTRDPLQLGSASFW